MPAQGGTTKQQLWTYGLHDTGPPLDVYGITDMNDNVIDLTDADKVLLSVGWSSPQHNIMGTQGIIKRGEGEVLGDPTEGNVRYNFIVDGDELNATGNYDFSWEIVWNDGTVQTVKSLSYWFLTVQAPPYANRGKYVPEDES